MKKINPQNQLYFRSPRAELLQEHVYQQEPSKRSFSEGYNTTRERIYTANHPKVRSATRYFERRAAKVGIFQKYNEKFPCPQREKAIVVGVLWHSFSEFMPWFLCQAAAQVSTNELRHYVIQTAFEELGMRDASQIHPDMFWQTALLAEVTEKDRREILSCSGSLRPIRELRKQLLECKSDSGVLGMLLGLEIPAQENIESIFSSLAWSAPLMHRLNRESFFVLHRQIEVEHVRLTIANFLRFASGRKSRPDFVRGFDNAIRFWKDFWDTVTDLTVKCIGGKRHA